MRSLLLAAALTLAACAKPEPEKPPADAKQFDELRAILRERDDAVAALVSENVLTVIIERDRLRARVRELERERRLREHVSQLDRQIAQWRKNEIARDHDCAGKPPSECVQITFTKATEWVVSGELNTLKTCHLDYTAIDRETAAYVVPVFMECNTDTYKVRFVWPTAMAGKLVMEKSTPINGEVRTAPPGGECPGKPQVFSSTIGRWLCVVPSGGSPHCYTPGPNDVLRSDDPPLCPEVLPLPADAATTYTPNPCPSMTYKVDAVSNVVTCVEKEPKP